MKKAFIQLHVAVFLAGFTAILGKFISLNEAWLVWYRLLLTALTMWVLFAITKKIQKLSLRDIIAVSLVGCLAALHWVGFYASIKYANVSVALVCFSSIGFFTSFMEPILERKRFNKTDMLLGLLTIVAISLIFHFDGNYKLGIIIGMASAVLGALFPIFNRQLLRRMNVESMLVWQQSGGLVCLSLIMPIYLHWFPASGFLPTGSDWIWLLVLSWVCSVWAFQLSSKALKELSAFTVNLSYNLEPVYGILLAFLIFNENQLLSIWFYLGFAIILLVLITHAWLLYRTNRRSQLINDN